MMIDNQQLSNEEHDIEEYSGGEVTSGHAPILKWLKWVYIFVPFWGLVCLWLYWNGSSGWLDPGYWNQLQKAANTTYPYHNIDQ